MSNVFEPKNSSIPLRPKREVSHSETSALKIPGGVALPPPRPRRRQCSLYLDVDMMEQVKRVAQKRGITIGAVIEACVKTALDQMED